MKKIIFFIISIIILHCQAFAKIQVVAAENFYENVAKLIGGDYIESYSIINKQNFDPHLFTISINDAILINNAKVIIYNGANYDNWIEPLLNVKKDNIIVIKVADLIKTHSINNPHLWYNPNTFPMLAKHLVKIFSDIDPDHAKFFELNKEQFDKNYKIIFDKINKIKNKFYGTNVTATEPIYNYMVNILGLKMLGETFQLDIMNDIEPTPKIIIEYKKLLTEKKIDILFYNEQIKNQLIDHILNIAKEQNILTVGILEIMRENDNIINWLEDTLNKTENMLEKKYTYNYFIK